MKKKEVCCPGGRKVLNLLWATTVRHFDYMGAVGKGPGKGFPNLIRSYRRSPVEGLFTVIPFVALVRSVCF